ncbi:MAG: gliding motility protein GldL [Prevotella sp.]|nr:gliding motility protein GldL [Prevotella sp.]
MTKYSKFNIIYRLQKWLDSVPGQTFMNYAYSWGASIVILGALFKLTHLPGANFWLFLGMGTEVFVFFIAGFDRPFDKTEDGKDLPTHVQLDDETGEGIAAGAPAIIGGGGPAIIGGTNGTSEGVVGEGSGSGTTIIGGGGGGGTIIFGGGGGNAGGSQQPAEGDMLGTTPVDTEAIAGVATSVAAMSGGVSLPEVPKMNPDLEEATTNYVDELKNLTEMLHKVAEQSERLSRDSEEMENLNRTLTGICKIYEMQLKGASQQIGTIDQINDQTRKMADQIAELNRIYARMIEAMTVNMKAVNS